MFGRGYVMNVGRGYIRNVGRGYVIHNSELVTKVGIELLGQLKKKKVSFYWTYVCVMAKLTFFCLSLHFPNTKLR